MPAAIGRVIKSISKRRDWYISVLAMRAAVAYRSCLGRVSFIGVTGSCGKTTTKELIAAIVETSGRGRKSVGNNNVPQDLARIILRARPWDAFCALEMGVGKRAEEWVFARSLQIARPRIAVVTNIQSDHISAFGSLEAIAAEKGKLVAALPTDGVAVLNADDPLVLKMQDRCAGQVITYGLSRTAAVRAEDVRSRWPDRLAFTLVYQDRRHPVQTQLCGTHWVHIVLAALATGIAMDIPLAKAIDAVRSFPPAPRRMSPEAREDGVTFIRDDYKNPLWAVPAAMQFMKEAQAKRKIVVVGTISDHKGEDAAAVSVARQALAVADLVIFVGPKAFKCMKAGTESDGQRLHPFLSLDHASETIGAMLRPGDLVLLKGTYKDDLGQLLSAKSPRPAALASVETTATAEVSAAGDVLAPPHTDHAGSPGSSRHGDTLQTGREEEAAPALWTQRKALRSRMHELYSSRNALFKQIGTAKRTGAGEVTALQAEAAKLSAELERLEQELEHIQRRIDGPSRSKAAPTPWVVGLGNPSEQLRNTPHNVGQAVVDLLAAKYSGSWIREGASLVSEVRWNEAKVLLVKPVVTINDTGPVLWDLARSRQLSPQYCVLVHDDVALPLGTVRSKGKGTDGGHRGVRSILEAFETDAFLRVKVGVATPARLADRIRGVLTPFTEDELQTLVRAYPVACATAWELLHMACTAPTQDRTPVRLARQARSK